MALNRARMSKIKNSELDQYGAEPFKQQQVRTADVEGVRP